MDVRIDDGLRIRALDGFELAATLYRPDPGEDRETAVLINSATAVKRRYYDPFARYLAGEGLTVLTYDYRGIGGSRPRDLSRFPAQLRQWAEEDQGGALDWIGHLHPRKILVVGHSVGGQIVGLAPGNDRIAGMVGVAAQNGYWGHWPSPSRYRKALTWYVGIPVASRLFGYVPGWLGIKEDLPAGVAREWAEWCRRPGFLFEGHDERRYGFESFDRPFLAYSFEDDDYAPRAAVESLLDAYREARVDHRHVTPREVGAPAIGHFGFFRERFRDTLWRESADWLRSQTAAA
jgi:predicted alpha/beta hydrolase